MLVEQAGVEELAGKISAADVQMLFERASGLEWSVFHSIAVSTLAGLVALAGPDLLQSRDLSPAQIAAKTRPAVVLVTALADDEEIAQGSGFVIDAQGTLVTNFHVVEGADAVTVQFAGGEIFDDVSFVAADRRRDVAVLKVRGANLPFITFGDDQQLAVGDRVYVMGNPLGLEGTFSDGLLSARRVDEGVAYLQITAPISSGSSGGPVLNGRGEVVGIATAVMRSGQNLNLAVTARYAQSLIATAARPRSLSDAREELAAETATGGDEWEAIVAEQVAEVDKLFEDEGYEPSHELQTGYMSTDETTTTQLDLDPGRYVFVGVCDGDCEDLDLAVHSPSGTLLGSDSEDDDVPVIEIDVASAGEYSFTAGMASCRTDTCFYGVRVLYKR